MRKIILPVFLSVLLTTSAGASILLDRVVAVIDKDVITWSELYEAMGFEFESKVKGLTREEKMSYFASVQKEFLENMVNKHLQIEEAVKRGVSVSDIEVKTAIRDIRKSYGVNEEQFKEALEREGFTYDGYYKRIKEQIQISKIVNAEVRGKIVVSDADVDKYLREHGEELPVNLSYEFSEIQLKRPENDEEKTAVEEILEAVRRKITAGVDFKEIMAEHSDNPVVKFTGDTDFIRADNLGKKILDAIKDLEEGAVTPPVDTDDGIFIIKILKIETPEEMEDVRDDIRKLLVNMGTEESYRKWVTELRRKAFIEIKL